MKKPVMLMLMMMSEQLFVCGLSYEINPEEDPKTTDDFLGAR